MSPSTSRMPNCGFFSRARQQLVATFLAVTTIFTVFNNNNKVFAWEPTWESLDSRPLPSWYDEAKFGIFIHWGVFSVPAFSSEWFWYIWKHDKDQTVIDYVTKTERPNFAYQDYAHRFDATLFDAHQWAELFAKAGAQYVVLTSKHHEGYCNWDSRDIPTTWGWNAMDVGPRRDILGELANATKATYSTHTNKALHWGVYHSLLEWFNPAYVADRKNNYSTTFFRDSKAIPELYDLVKKYEPELIWSDGEWQDPDSYWKAAEFLAWYATESAVADTAVWNDRWGSDINCKHGAYLNCVDRFEPGHLMTKKWENALTIDSWSWGFNRKATYDQYFSVTELVHKLIETVAFGGNMLLNVGPNADGTIDAIFGDRLVGIGDWLHVNGDAIYATTPWLRAQNETKVGAYYTRGKDDTLYALVTKWPKDSSLTLEAPQATPKTSVRMLGLDDSSSEKTNSVLDFSAGTGSGSDGGVTGNSVFSPGMTIQVPKLTPNIIPCQHAWVFAITDVGNLDDEVEQQAVA